jgi:hypothetical protein
VVDSGRWVGLTCMATQLSLVCQFGGRAGYIAINDDHGQLAVLTRYS